MNIPIYRAKKIGSDEYVEGDLHIHKREQVVGKRYIKETSYYILTHRKIDSNPNSFDGMCITDTMIYTKIDPTTLAIHFPDMLDNQGNKIFASLQEDGKGGDIVADNGMFLGVTKYDIQSIYYGNFRKDDFFSWAKLKVIGIQE